MAPHPDIAEFTDPRLVAVYDSVNSYEPGAQPDFVLRRAAEIGAESIVDLGCGTGLVTCLLAGRGYRMTGVEPSAPMLTIARRREHGDRVHWIEGDAASVGAPAADLAIMTGHVAQFFLTDASWHAALVALHDALRPGGRLVFESRNPAAEAWKGWSRATGSTVHDPDAGPIETWVEVDDVHDGIVSFVNHYLFVARHEELRSAARLRFRTEAEMTRSLADAGFGVERSYGDWDLSPVRATAPELIVVAVRPATT